MKLITEKIVESPSDPCPWCGGTCHRQVVRTYLYGTDFIDYSLCEFCDLVNDAWFTSREYFAMSPLDWLDYAHPETADSFCHGWEGEDIEWLRGVLCGSE